MYNHLNFMKKPMVASKQPCFLLVHKQTTIKKIVYRVKLQSEGVPERLISSLRACAMGGHRV